MFLPKYSDNPPKDRDHIMIKGRSKIKTSRPDAVYNTRSVGKSADNIMLILRAD